MTESAYISFVKGHLRKASRWWKPITDTIKKANTRRGFYLCNGCKEEVPKSVKIDGKRINNVYCDHRNPIVDPKTGFSGWDNFVNGLFCEADNLQVLCKTCHDRKSSEERASRPNKKKDNNEPTIQ